MVSISELYRMVMEELGMAMGFMPMTFRRVVGMYIVLCLG